jgi:hypothetical protein
MRTNPLALLAAAATGLAVMLSTSACVGRPAGSSDGAGTNATPTAAANATTVPCQASGVELYIYLQGDKAMFDQAGKPKALGDPVCADKYAVVPVKSDSASATPEYVLFSYDVQNTKWAVVAAGPAGLCAGKVPDPIAKVLTGCNAA